MIPFNLVPQTIKPYKADGDWMTSEQEDILVEIRDNPVPVSRIASATGIPAQQVQNDLKLLREGGLAMPLGAQPDWWQATTRGKRVIYRIGAS